MIQEVHSPVMVFFSQYFMTHLIDENHCMILNQSEERMNHVIPNKIDLFFFFKQKNFFPLENSV